MQSPKGLIALAGAECMIAPAPRSNAAAEAMEKIFMKIPLCVVDYHGLSCIT